MDHTRCGTLLGPPFMPVMVEDLSSLRLPRYISITAMKEYRKSNKSTEELRQEDCRLGRNKLVENALPASNASYEDKETLTKETDEETTGTDTPSPSKPVAVIAPFSGSAGTPTSYQPTIVMADHVPRTPLMSLQCINCMVEYQGSSLEELRFQDYKLMGSRPQVGSRSDSNAHSSSLVFQREQENQNDLMEIDN